MATRAQNWAREEITAITTLLTILDTLRALRFEADQLNYRATLQASDVPATTTVVLLFQAIDALHGLELAAQATPTAPATQTVMQQVYAVRE